MSKYVVIPVFLLMVILGYATIEEKLGHIGHGHVTEHVNPVVSISTAFVLSFVLLLLTIYESLIKQGNKYHADTERYRRQHEFIDAVRKQQQEQYDKEKQEIASYAGFPVRYPHWKFGEAYEKLFPAHNTQKVIDRINDNGSFIDLTSKESNHAG